MQIIPVIDLMGGQVVHARGGQRSEYRPVKSVITQSASPVEVITDLLHFYPFQQIYIADLDAIETSLFDEAFYKELAKQFAGVDFWIDSGIRTAEQFTQRAQAITASHIVGSETLQELTLLQLPEFMQQGILSLDFKAGKIMGGQRLLDQPKFWPQRVIVMTLDRVGAGSGPNFELLKQLKITAPKCCFFAAGGVRGETDLIRLAKERATGALIASCLHNGQLGREQIDKYGSQDHRSS